VRRLREILRRFGGGLVGPLVLVGATGLLEMLVYNADPSVANARLAGEDALFGFVRSLHLWSSRALLAGAVLHTASVWYERRTGGRHRRAYLTGSLFLGVLAFAHMTGFVLRWDGSADRLLDYEVAVLPFATATSLASWQLPIHVAILGGLALLVALLHLGQVGRGPASDPGTSPPRKWDWRVAAAAFVVVVGLLAVVAPAPAAQARTPWPMGPFAQMAGFAGQDAAFGISGLFVWGLVALVPEMGFWGRLARSAKWGLAALFAASFLPS